MRPNGTAAHRILQLLVLRRLLMVASQRGGRLVRRRLLIVIVYMLVVVDLVRLVANMLVGSRLHSIQRMFGKRLRVLQKRLNAYIALLVH